MRVLIVALLLWPLAAQAIDRSQCKQFGGSEYCWEPAIGRWTYTLCAENSDINYPVVECTVKGGTKTQFDCLNPTRPATEGDLVPLGQDIVSAYRGPFCEGPTGGPLTWGMVFTSNRCFNGGGAGFNQGHYNSDSSTFPVRGKRLVSGTCQTTDFTLQFDAGKSRPVACAGNGDSSFGFTTGATPSLCSKSFWFPVNPKTPPCCGPMAGNPINPSTGAKYVVEVDYVGHGPQPLRFERTYNSRIYAGDGGRMWRHNYMARISDQTTFGTVPTAVVYRPNGQIFFFTLNGGQYLPDADIADRLTRLTDGGGILTGWQYYRAGSESLESYDAEGKLVSIADRAGLTQTLEYSTAATPPSVALEPGLLIRVTDAFGRQLNFTYDAKARLATMQDPEGQSYTYEQVSLTWIGPVLVDHFTSVTYPGNKKRKYLYNESAFVTNNRTYGGLLTGIVDENDSRFATYFYDFQGMAVRSEHAGGAGRVDVNYNGSWTGSVNVSDARGTVRTDGFSLINDVWLNTSITQPNASGTGNATSFTTYDANGNLASQTDFNGNRTNYTFDLARNLETSRTEGLTAAGATTPQTRTISTQWDTNFRLPSAIAEPLRITTMVYDATGTTCGAKGALCSKSIQATTDANGAQGFSATPTGSPRAWAYTYNANGNVLTIDGPRTDVSDVTTYTYYPNDDATPGNRGMLQSVTNALSQTTQVTSYNAHGKALTIVDPNGLTTALTYDERQRLKSRSVGGELTSYDYDGVGQLTKVTLPDGSFLSYSYDTAHRLTGMQDNLGNSVTYTLDAMDNRTQEQVKDPSNALAQTRSRVYNNLNRLFRELGATSQITEYTYDNQGNVLTVKDPLNHVTTNQYDALNRLKQATAPAPVSAVTQYAYNGLDALTQVTDPRALVTGYAVDGLGNLTQQSSPDTGNTVSTYDAAGNLLTQTDAKSQTTTYTYDALNRVTLITFHDASKQVYAYDQGSNGIGRLSSITERNPADVVTAMLTYAYDQHGRVTSETRGINGVNYVLGYSYDSFGRLAGLTYPSGRTVTYSFDTLGRVSAIITAASGALTQTVVSSVAYHPFGGVKSYTLGNGQAYTRSIDLDGRIASYTLGAKTYAIGYDDASRIVFISDTAVPANSNTYGYDALDRLTQAVTPGTPYAYGYDAVGNRLSRTAGSGTENYTYSSTSNRIATVGTRSFVFDPNGSTTSDALNTYVYDTRGRMVQATSAIGATSYQVNALGQRIRKTNSSTDRIFHYDTRGRLIAESDPGGTVKREIFYLGDIPVGVLQ